MAIFIHSAGTNGSWCTKALSWCLTWRLKKGFEVKTQVKQFWLSFRLHTNQGPVHIILLHAPWEMFTDHRSITYSDLHGNSDTIQTIILFRDAKQAAQNTWKLLYAFIYQIEILNRYKFKTWLARFFNFLNPQTHFLL